MVNEKKKTLFQIDGKNSSKYCYEYQVFSFSSYK